MKSNLLAGNWRKGKSIVAPWGVPCSTCRRAKTTPSPSCCPPTIWTASLLSRWSASKAAPSIRAVMDGNTWRPSPRGPLPAAWSPCGCANHRHPHRAWCNAHPQVPRPCPSRNSGPEIDGILEPPRFRPLPNSPVFALDQQETEEKLKLAVIFGLGLAVGYENMAVAIPSTRKDVFPRHIRRVWAQPAAVNPPPSLVGQEALRSQMSAVDLFDTEGEYTHIMEPTTDKHAGRFGTPGPRSGRCEKRADLRRDSSGAKRQTRNIRRIRNFRLEFSNLSPYTVMEILDLTDAQQERFLNGVRHRPTGHVASKSGPSDAGGAQSMLEIDDMEHGYPGIDAPTHVLHCPHVGRQY